MNVERPRIAILASPATRKFGAPAHQFVDQHRDRLRSYRIVTTGGVYSDLFADKGDLTVEQYPAHDQGGLVKVAADIADGNCQGVLTFADISKQQGYISYSLHNAILNQAIWADIEMIINPHSTSIWVTGKTGVVDPGKETLALIAHSKTDNRKPKEAIIKFADEFAEEFSRFQRIICTGTTGGAG